MAKRKIKTITDLRDSLCDLYTRLLAGTVDRKQAQEINNSAGKILATAKLQLEYVGLIKDLKGPLNFFDAGEFRAIKTIPVKTKTVKPSKKKSKK